MRISNRDEILVEAGRSAYSYYEPMVFNKLAPSI